MQKKHFIPLLALLLLSFVTYVFLYPPIKNQCPEVPKNISSTNTQKVSPDTGSLCINFESFEPSELKAGLVREMISKYRTNQLTAIQGSTSMAMSQDAHSIWFDIDTLKKFIYHIEKGAKQNGINSSSSLGLRFYYAAYPEKVKWGTTGYEALAGFLGDATTEAYEKRHTLVIMPTLKIGSNNTDFNPRDPLTYTNGLAGVLDTNTGFDSLRPIQVLTSTLTTNNTTQIGARNHGQLIPPASGSGEAF
jgi:hypothetical protein